MKHARMKHALSAVWICAASLVVLAACDSSGGTACEGASCDGGGSDAGIVLPRPDSSVVVQPPDAAMVSCDLPPSTGNVGGRCNAGDTCNGSLVCVPASVGRPTVRRFLSTVEQAQPVPGTPERFEPRETPDPAQDVPISLSVGSLCTDTCDMTSFVNTCGPCAVCWDGLGQDRTGFPVGAYINSPFGINAGLCRPVCEFDPDTNGDCGDGFSCDPLTLLCLEACVDDTQCSARTVRMENGNLGTYVDPEGGQVCNRTTGRCTWTPAGDPQPGDACERDTDCASDVGVCRRGSCIEFGCVDETPEGLCGDGNGVCVSRTQCVGGCVTSDDCTSGNACVPLQSGGIQVTVGPYNGVCRATCDGILNDADDVLIACGNMEQCDQPVATTMNPDPSGICRPTCDPMASDCDAGEICEPANGADYGFCRALDRFCQSAADCFGEQICSVRTSAGFLGRCVEPCTMDSECTAPQTCILEGEFQGLCATPCTATAMGTMCASSQSCLQPTGSMTTYCVKAN